MPEDVELVEENGCLGTFLLVDFRNGFHISMTARGIALLRFSPKNAKKFIHAFLGAVFAAESEGMSPLEIAHNDPVGMAFADRDLVNANDLGSRLIGASDLLAHILHLKRFDSLPIKKVVFGHILNGRGST
jgi:hypothetical protein